MDSVTQQRLEQYLAEISMLPNESAKTHRFAQLVGELFPSSKALYAIAGGIENRVLIDTDAGLTKSGRIDLFYGNAVIEFEASLRKTGDHAVAQLREYAAGIWQKPANQDRPLLCIASDGKTWRVYRPIRKYQKSGQRLKPANLDLVLIREIELRHDTLREFWIWLTTLLFREPEIEPSAERFRTDFGATSLAYSHGIDALRRAWEHSKQQSEAKLAFETWSRYLAVTYGKFDDRLDELFLKHTYLVSIARLLIWAALSGATTKTTLGTVARKVLSGEYFLSEGIENLVEHDFFWWILRSESDLNLGPFWERVLAQLQTYRWDQLDQDILKGVYQELIDPKDRHDLGEYYTPDWLCERIVSELLPGTGFVSVLDPASGSGSFLRAAIVAMLERNPSVSSEEKLSQITKAVTGIEIHPVAVTISRATYVLALRELLKSARQPVTIPVYLADSLFLPAEVKQLTLGKVPSYQIRFGDKDVELPESLVLAVDRFDAAIAAAAAIADAHAKSGRESEATLRAYIRRRVPTVHNAPDADSVCSALWDFANALADLIRRKRNSIWAFVVRNGYRPAMLRQHFDVIVGNPPWLSYRFISDPEYQREVRTRAIDEYGVAPRKKALITQMELASVFLAHTMSHFGNDNAKLGFVMPRSVLSADQHQQIRLGTYNATFVLTSYWDLDGVTPIFSVPCAVVFAVRRRARPGVHDTLPVLEWSGRLANRDSSWAEASKVLSNVKKTGYLIRLGERTAFSTDKTLSSRRSSTGSVYKSSFRQGASLVPRNFYFVSVRRTPGEPTQPDGLYWCETDSDQAKEAKKPYREIVLSGQIEGRFIFYTALSKHLVPFALTGHSEIVLPIDLQAGAPCVLSADTLRQSGFRGIADWMIEVERHWRRCRGDKAENETVYSWLDYQSKLTNQNLEQKNFVVYNHSGMNVSAAAICRKDLPAPFIIDVKMYWAPCHSAEEANYLAAVLNSSYLNVMIKPFQSRGLLGERDIHKKLLEAPIPAYSQAIAAHERLATLGAMARDKVLRTVCDSERTIANRRKSTRAVIADELAAIDETVKSLF